MKPEFVPWLWIIYVAYVLHKRYKENSRLENYEIILAILSLIAVCGGYLLTLYFNLSLSDTGIFWVILSFLFSIILMKLVFGV